jgi:hypothetical protein
MRHHNFTFIKKRVEDFTPRDYPTLISPNFKTDLLVIMPSYHARRMVSDLDVPCTLLIGFRHVNLDVTSFVPYTR